MHNDLQPWAWQPQKMAVRKKVGKEKGGFKKQL
jgi:hypothetical protein